MKGVSEDWQLDIAHPQPKRRNAKSKPQGFMGALRDAVPRKSAASLEAPHITIVRGGPRGTTYAHAKLNKAYNTHIAIWQCVYFVPEDTLH